MVRRVDKRGKYEAERRKEVKPSQNALAISL
jgi:hypothetical protein